MQYPPLPEANSESIHTETPAVPSIQTGEQKLSLPCPLVILLSGLLHSLFCAMMFMVHFVRHMFCLQACALLTDRYFFRSCGIVMPSFIHPRCFLYITESLFCVRKNNIRDHRHSDHNQITHKIQITSLPVTQKNVSGCQCKTYDDLFHSFTPLPTAKPFPNPKAAAVHTKSTRTSSCVFNSLQPASVSKITYFSLIFSTSNTYFCLLSCSMHILRSNIIPKMTNSVFFLQFVLRHRILSTFSRARMAGSSNLPITTVCDPDPFRDSGRSLRCKEMICPLQTPADV